MSQKGVKYIVAGTDTDIGKTYVSALLMKSLPAESVYIKPIQTGYPEYCDADFVHDFTGARTCTILKYKDPASPHLCAKIENREIVLADLLKQIFVEQNRESNSLIELAGGLYVPINESETNLDIIKLVDFDTIFLVSRPDLGTLNHTLLSIEALKGIGIKTNQITVIINFVHDSKLDFIIEENITFLSNKVECIIVKYNQKNIEIK